MTQIYHLFRQILNGTCSIENAIKYKIIGFGIAIVHLIFTIVFGVCHVIPLFLYNAAITIFYFYLSFFALKKKKYVLIYIATVIEVLFHSAMASLLLGWDCGFMIYTIAIIPVAFYLTYTLPHFEGSIAAPVISSTAVVVCYMLVRVICGRCEPFYKGNYPDNLPAGLYYFNSIVTFVLMVSFSILFALEIRYMQRQLEQENHTLGQIANYDPLTHLLNRRSMDTRLKYVMENAVSTKKTFSLIMADLDDFKRINDTYGHECGDKVLITISDIITRNLREEDCVCRWGGEEILILINADLEVSGKVAERIRKEVEETVISYKENEVRVTVTLGVSTYQEGIEIPVMIEYADRKLYEGKNNGKNQVVA
ncbi:MAG: GGDEF domain-containing protein [Lachnospiraceae bacterium]